jgi:hypothetical protein
MKKFALCLLMIGAGVFNSYGQVVTSEPVEYTDPSQQLKLIVNLDQLDQTLDHVINLIADADAGLDLYIWTWKPFEFPAGSPKANGLGGAPWKNSNDALVMTKEADHIYSITMVPTEFYEVDAATVYAEDIHFLVKPKDGGGYGDPDRKSTDLTFEVNPPNIARPVVYGFPSHAKQDDIFRIVYDNDKELKTSMQNIGSGNCYIYLEVTLVDGTVIRPSNFFQVGSNPNLEMADIGGGSFEKAFIPQDFFGLTAGQKIATLKAVVMKKTFLSGDDRVDNDFLIDIAGCN